MSAPSSSPRARRAARTFALACALASPAVDAADPTDAPGTAAAAADPTFTASFVTRERLRADVATCRTFPFLAGTTTGTGQASGLGPVTGSGTDCIHASLKGRFSFRNGRMTIVTTSGDRIRAEYSGTLTRTATARVYAITGTYRITGGTGRFAAATGSGTLSGVENLFTLRGRLAFSGTLAYRSIAVGRVAAMQHPMGSARGNYRNVAMDGFTRPTDRLSARPVHRQG